MRSPLPDRFALEVAERLGSLDANVNRLLVDSEAQRTLIEKHGQLIEGLRREVSWVRGAIAMATVVLASAGWFATHLLDGKLQAIASSLASAHK